MEVSVAMTGKKGGIQQTRKHLADSTSGLEEYLIEDIITMRWTKGHRERLVRWKGNGAKDDTGAVMEHQVRMKLLISGIFTVYLMIL
ncbi:hypothetical protein CYMTET_45621 [Cymbomonas tetramitiformis]|uniref:Chromo domain-containing protein n=1 Tax=Cymbomonas tetramitiformis TaxID=36881 RepID=A0AAE0BXW4_9CHLO|nr:hypothetical protein CYMTET_45621 [Cymbomonas tetramitiformis]